MCVLTFLPIANSGYILTNNRDEATARPKAIPPKKYNINGKQIYFPKDAQANEWYEDRGERREDHPNGTRYGHREGQYHKPNAADYFTPTGQHGYDQPSDWDPGDILKFRLVLVDVCNGKTLDHGPILTVTF